MYLGNQPALSYTSFAKQDFTTSATTSYTLDNPVANANELALFINFVRQEPTTAYTASGTSLTLTSATSASDDMYCVFLGKAVQTVNPPSGSVGTAQIADLAVTSGKLASGVLPTNTPAFEAYGSLMANQADNTWIKLAFNAEKFDTNSMYDTSAYRFTPTVAGKYYVYSFCSLYSDTTYKLYVSNLAIYKNGSSYKYTPTNNNPSAFHNENFETVLATIDMNGSSDYVEIYGRANVDSGFVGIDLRETIGGFGAYKIIE